MNIPSPSPVDEELTEGLLSGQLKHRGVEEKPRMRMCMWVVVVVERLAHGYKYYLLVGMLNVSSTPFFKILRTRFNVVVSQTFCQ